MKTQITVNVYRYDENYRRELVFSRVCRTKREAEAVADTVNVVTNWHMSCVEFKGAGT